MKFIFSLFISLRLVVLCSLLVWCVSGIASAQTTNGLPGKWIVTKVIVSEESKQKDGVEMMCNLFTKSVFQLKPDQSCVFDCKEPELAIRNGKWIYNAQKKSIDIIDPQNTTHVLMSLQVKNEQGKWFFLLDESPFVLEVAKL